MWYQNIRSGLFGFVTKHACDRQTDRRTDRITTLKTALAYLRRAVKMIFHIDMTLSRNPFHFLGLRYWDDNVWAVLYTIWGWRCRDPSNWRLRPIYNAVTRPSSVDSSMKAVLLVQINAVRGRPAPSQQRSEVCGLWFCNWDVYRFEDRRVLILDADLRIFGIVWTLIVRLMKRLCIATLAVNLRTSVMKTKRVGRRRFADLLMELQTDSGPETT